METRYDKNCVNNDKCFTAWCLEISLSLDIATAKIRRRTRRWHEKYYPEKEI